MKIVLIKKRTIHRSLYFIYYTIMYKHLNTSHGLSDKSKRFLSLKKEKRNLQQKISKVASVSRKKMLIIELQVRTYF